MENMIVVVYDDNGLVSKFYDDLDRAKKAAIYYSKAYNESVLYIGTKAYRYFKGDRM